MPRNVVGVGRRAARWLALVMVTLVMGAGGLYAQATGKIEGHVRDQVGAPIANAQVFIPGTAFNTLSSSTGYYFFNNIPSGTVDIRAAFIGYKATLATGVRVSAGQTVTQDIQLESNPIGLDTLTVTVSRIPLVPRDQVTSKQRIDGDYSMSLPIDRVTSIIAVQPGVVASASGNTISIRGGRTDEAGIYVDGVPVNAGYRGTGFVGSVGTTISIGVNNVQEASVTTGGIGAGEGNAQSGIINIETRSGGSHLAGNVGYETDEPFGVNHGYGFNRVQGSLGGPLMGNLTFFLSGVLEGRQAQIAGLDADKYPLFVQARIDTTVAVPSALNDPNADTSFVDISQFAVGRGNCDTFSGSTNAGIANNYGLDCRGIRTPGTASTRYELAGKVNYTFGAGNRLFLSWQRSRNQGRNSTYAYTYNPQLTQGFRNWNNNFTLGWTQNLSHSADRALALDVNLAYQQDRTINTVLDAESELKTRDPFGGFILGDIGFAYDFDNFPLNQELVDNYRNNTPGSRRSPLVLEQQAQYTDIDRWRNDAYGTLGFSESGPVAPGDAVNPATFLNLYRENRLIGKANLDWQIDRYNRLKVGGEFTHYNMSSYSSGLITQAFSDVFIEKPIRYDAFVENRLDLGDVVVVGGLRYDYYNSEASRPFVLDTVAGRSTFGQYHYFPRLSSYGAGGATFQNQPLVKFVADPGHSYISPHIQVSFPVTDRTNFRLSYAHQVQAPDFALILGGINTDLSVTNTNHVYGSDLDFGKTITFEFGIRHAFNDDMVLDVSAYNRDKLSDAAGRLVSFGDPNRFGENVDLRIITNADFGNARGIDVRLDRRIGRFFNGVLAYTFQSAKNTGTNPFTYINFGSRIISQISGGNQPPPQGIFPTGNSRPQNLTGSFALTLPRDWMQGSTVGSLFQNSSVTALFRYSSGTSYTRCPNDTGNEGVISGQVCSREFEGDFFGARLPSFKQLDMRFTRSFALGGLDLTAYLDARNILNFKNILGVFATTNDVVNNAELVQHLSGDSTAFANEAIASGVYGADGSIDLRFSGAAASGCGSWVNAQGPATPNCVYLVRAEERFGNGDHVFSIDEQRRASEASYLAGASSVAPARGLDTFTGEGRRLRVGFEVTF
ncbi:MAG: TonB-dependent receptor [Gemmatimonadota bacterium]